MASGALKRLKILATNEKLLWGGGGGEPSIKSYIMHLAYYS